MSDTPPSTETKRSSSPGAEEILGRYFPGARPRVRGAGRLHGHRRRHRAGRPGELRLRHPAAQQDPGAHPLPAAPQAHHPQRDGGAEVPLLHAHLHRPPVDPASHGQRQRVQRPLFADSHALLLPQAEQRCRPRAAATTRAAAGSPSTSGWPAEAAARWTESRRRAAETYEWLTGHDVARELARIDLPLSTYTQWYWKIDLHNLLHFLTLRVDPHSQWEIQQFGRVMAGMLKRVAPLSYEAWIDYDVCGAPLSRMELSGAPHGPGPGRGGRAAQLPRRRSPVRPSWAPVCRTGRPRSCRQAGEPRAPGLRAGPRPRAARRALRRAVCGGRSRRRPPPEL